MSKEEITAIVNAIVSLITVLRDADGMTKPRSTASWACA